jgi:hypothetical protein
MSPKSRLALFTVALIALVAIAASQPRHGVSLTKAMTKSMDDMCVCVPTRAKLMIKEAITKTRGAAKLVASNVTASR